MITNNNTLDIWNEQSNVGERVFFPNLWEGLILRDWMGNQGPVPGLATEWKRLDDKTIELKLRQGVRFHNGDELTAEDVVFSFSDERLFAGTEPAGGKTLYAESFKPQSAKELPANVPGIARRLWPALRGVEAVDKYTVRFHNATPDVTLEGRLYAFGSQIANKRAWTEAASYADWAAKPVTTGPYMVEEFPRLWLNDGSCIRLRPEYPDHVWSYDFVESRTHDGRKFRMLNLINEYAKECLAIRVDRKLNSTDDIDVLTDHFILRGIPAHIRSDNGPEFIALAVRDWIVAVGAITAYIGPGSP